MNRYRLDPVFKRAPCGGVESIVGYHIFLDNCRIGGAATWSECHDFLDVVLECERHALSQPNVTALRRAA